jgi:outer membrane lipoprotein-sorting protein
VTHATSSGLDGIDNEGMRVRRQGYSGALLLLLAQASSGAEALDYLKSAARRYTGPSSFQVEAIVETTSSLSGNDTAVRIRMSLYFTPPDRARIDLQDSESSLQTVMIWDGTWLTDFHPWDHSVKRTPMAGFDLSFTPERGQGLGEMLYDTIGSGVTASSIRGREKLRVGNETIACVIVDVEYARDREAPKYSFWISEDRGIVLKRRVTFGSNGERRTLTSSIVALTFNEVIPGTVFKFATPAGRTVAIRVGF